jgi:hypothetical protein
VRERERETESERERERETDRGVFEVFKTEVLNPFLS